MAFRKIHYLALGLALSSMLNFSPAAAQDWYDGIYITARFGGVLPHPYTQPVRVQLGEETYRPKLHARVGFTTNAALGFWFNFFDVGRLRAEMEAGYFLYELAGRPKIPRPQLSANEGRGAITAIALSWNAYFNFLPRSSPHQPWIGAGIGTARWQQTYYYRRSQDRAQKWDLSVLGALGYDYRLTDQLAIGAAYRYYHLFSFPKLKHSQLLITISYGF